MRRPRHLSPEERELWDLVAKRTKPLEPGKPKNRPVEKRPAPVPPRLLSTQDPIPNFQLGQKADISRAHNLRPSVTDALRAAPLQMDHKTHGKMTKGKLVPEARIDLHGMTVAEAHPALISFILSAQSNGLRLVLVITGKGKDRDDGGPIPTRYGVLRHQVPQWLHLAPCRQAVMQVTPAHQRHGGHGAYYVYLRRIR